MEPFAGEKLSHLGSDDKSKEEILSAILLIYNTSKSRIFQAADILGRGIIGRGENPAIHDGVRELSLPETEIWNFHLGDHVRVKLERENFMWMQKKTLGWNELLKQVIPHNFLGIVTNVLSEYDNSIGVYFPQIYSVCSLYAGLLEKVEPEDDPNMLCRWKPGDYVTTIPSTKALQILQRGLDEIPPDLIGKRGRVIGVAYSCVMVTFDEKTTMSFKASSLVRCKDESPLLVPEVKHARGFEVGEKVGIISNLKKLIENQKGKSKWTPGMTSVRGKAATVNSIQEDGTLDVQPKHFRAWRLSPDSVLRKGEKEPVEEDLNMAPGEIVKVVVPRSVLGNIAGLPSSFLEYLRVTAVLSQVDDDFCYFIRFNQDQNIKAHDDTFRRATTSEKKMHERVEKMVADIKKGSKVHLDIGPPNYVQTVLADIDVDPLVKMALTKSATLIGYINPYVAVIEYENGSRFRMKKKLLTVPEKFHVGDSGTVSLETAKVIRDKIKMSVENIHRRKYAVKEDCNVEPIFMYHGNPPCVEFQISSAVATRGDIFKWMERNSGWKVEFLGEGQFMVTGAEAANMEVKVGVVSDGEKSGFVSDLVVHGEMKHAVTSGGFEDGAERKKKADPDEQTKPTVEQPKMGGMGDSKDKSNPNVFYIYGGYPPKNLLGTEDEQQCRGSMVQHIGSLANIHIYQ